MPNDQQSETNIPAETYLSKKERKRLKREQKLAGQNAGSASGSHRWGWWLLIIVILAGLVYGLYRVATRPAVGGGTGASLTVPVSAADWQRGGNLQSPATLVEYSDFQCPACSFYEAWIRQLSEDFGTQLNFVYRQFPLRQAHINADLASRASEAAGKQNKFWEMHDKLFDTQTDWSDRLDAKSVFTNFAKELKLDVARFTADLNSPEVKKLIEADYQGGVAAGVKGTPSFYLNGKKIDPNPQSYEDLSVLIQGAIDQSVTAATSTSATTTNASNQ